MTDSDLWREVGRSLADARVRQGFDTPRAFWLKHRQPAINTIRDIEAGRPGNVASLGVYARALGLELPRLIVAVVERIDGTAPPLSPAARTIGERFDAAGNADLTRAIWGLAMMLPEKPAPASPVPPGADHGPRSKATGRTRVRGSTRAR